MPEFPRRIASPASGTWTTAWLKHRQRSTWRQSQIKCKSGGRAVVVAERVGGGSDEAASEPNVERNAHRASDPALVIAAAFKAAGLPVPNLSMGPNRCGSRPDHRGGAQGRRCDADVTGFALNRRESPPPSPPRPSAPFRLLRRSPNSAGVSATGLKPSVSSFFLIAGSAAILTMASCHLSMMACGVPAGAKMPVKVSLSRPGTPSSILVGKSGQRHHALLGQDGDAAHAAVLDSCRLPAAAP